MQFAIVTDRWDEAGGGRERYFAELVRFTARARCRARVFCRAIARTAATRVCLNTERRPDLHVFPGPYVWGDFRMRHAVARYRERHPERPVLTAQPFPGVTHYQLLSGIYARVFAAEREALEPGVQRALFQPALKLNSRRTRLLRMEERTLAESPSVKLMVSSRALANDLRSLFGVSPDRIRVSPLGIDVDRFRPAAERPARARGDRLRLLFVGHNFVLKGLSCALAALGRLQAGGLNAQLIVAGRGSIGAYRAVAARLRVGDRVTFVGSLDQTALVDAYRACDALIHPAFYDPFPLVILEALASGCPVVTTRACGASEVITPGVDGFVINDPRDTDALAAAIACLADRDRLERMRAAAAQRGCRLRFDDHARTVVEWLQLADAPGHG